jgi:hypothetical protein
VATWQGHGPVYAISKALDRDRAVDESGNQVAVFGRIGGRPMDLDERRRFYEKNGDAYRVNLNPTVPPIRNTEEEQADPEQPGIRPKPRIRPGEEKR